MGELRRDDGPADRIPSGDRPAKNAETHKGPPDLAEPHSIDRHKTTPAQRDFHRETGDGPLETENVPYSISWRTGERTDRSAPSNKPESNHSRYADPPKDFNRANSNLEAGTIQRTDEARVEEIKPADTTKKRRRALIDKSYENTEDVLQDVHDAVDKVGIFHRPPTYTAIGSAPPPPHLAPPLYGAHSAGDAAAALTAGAFLLTAAGHKMHEKIDDWKGRHGGNQ